MTASDFAERVATYLGRLEAAGPEDEETRVLLAEARHRLAVALRRAALICADCGGRGGVDDLRCGRCAGTGRVPA